MNVNPVGADPSTTNEQFNSVLDDNFQSRLRSFGVSATVLRLKQGVVLEGVSPTFYGKQMAQELARKAKLVVVANRIRVERT
jgi:hypothetical protein